MYTPENVGHFGLAYDAYAHFTSPIRRYPDLLVHRGIKAVLAGKRYEGVDWNGVGIHCSETERRADDATRDVEAWLKTYFMQDHVGEEFDGTISGVTSFGLFVTLDELYVDGLVHISDLGQDYFQFDSHKHMLRGERTGVKYQLAEPRASQGGPREPRAGQDRLRARQRATAAVDGAGRVEEEAARHREKREEALQIPMNTLIGFHAVTARLRQKPDTVTEIYIDQSRNDGRARDLRELAKKLDVRVIPVDAKRLDGMSGGAKHQGVVAQAQAIDMPKFIEDVLDGLKEPPCC